ncbi:hypothetical protein CBM2637_A30028 [Cupriavidus taiwanensis]|nr:hypothetical protein CBM2637_A30028 [Cupriavidus taiwanensis]
MTEKSVDEPDRDILQCLFWRPRKIRFPDSSIYPITQCHFGLALLSEIDFLDTFDYQLAEYVWVVGVWPSAAKLPFVN